MGSMTPRPVSRAPRGATHIWLAERAVWWAELCARLYPRSGLGYHLRQWRHYCAEAERFLAEVDGPGSVRRRASRLRRRVRQLTARTQGLPDATEWRQVSTRRARLRIGAAPTP